MDIKIIRHDEQLMALWINTTDINIVNKIAEDFLKGLDTINTTFKIKKCSIWKKDDSMIKVEYAAFIKKGTPKTAEIEAIQNRKYSLIITNKLTNNIENIIDSFHIIKERIIGLNLQNLNKMRDLQINESLNLNYYFDWIGEEPAHYEYTITRLS
jgi:hypothetical protein